MQDNIYEKFVPSIHIFKYINIEKDKLPNGG